MMSLMRYWVSVPLITVSPLHSSGIDEAVDRVPDPDEDRIPVPRRFSRTVDGTPSLSGRSVKGALRSAMTRYFPEKSEHYKPLWGSLDAGSPLTVHPIVLTDVCTGSDLPTRSGIAVDRYWGTAGDGALFQHEVVPAGVPLLVEISAHVPVPDAGGGAVTSGIVEEFFADLSALFEVGLVAFGGRRSAGWGRVRLEDGAQVSCRRADLRSRAGLLAFHTGGDEVTLPLVTPPSASERITIDISWHSPTGILVADGISPDAETSDGPEVIQPLRAAGPDCAFVIPGSSIRGALRARCSRIARTILAEELLADDWADLDVHEQLRSDPLLVRRLFGDADAKGAVSALDTLAADRSLRRQTHNAGDRFTGGVVDGFLFTEDVPDGTWNDIRLEIDTVLLSRLDSDEQDPNFARAALCLLGLALAELASGALPLGSRTTRGLGEVRVEALRVDGPEEFIGAPWRISDEGAPRATAEAVLAQLRRINDHLPPGGWSRYLQEGTVR